MSDPLKLIQDDIAELETAGAAGNITQTCPAVKIEYGVFFDGTGNNEANYLKGKDMRAVGQKTSDSYDNDRSNVSRLKDVYKGKDHKTTNDCGGPDTIFRSRYVPGVGTTTRDYDDNIGLALGMGETGVWHRVAQAFIDIRGELFLQAAKGEISEITFDIFGFSRGAAAARHFANLLKDPHPFLYQDDYQYFNKYSNYTYPNEEPSMFPMSIVKIRFIGLFDCVVSTGLVADDDNYPGLRIGLADDLAEKVINLRAADEFRENFSSTSVLAKSHPLYGGKEGAREEIVGPGAHSDIGGGYPKHFPEAPVIDYTKQTDSGLFGSGLFDDEIEEHLSNPVILDSHDHQRMNHLIKEQWVYPNEIQDTYRKIPIVQEGISHHIVLERPFVDHRLSRIYLHIMHELAIENGIAFLPALPDGDDYDIPTEELNTIKEKVKARLPLSASEALHVKRNYVHHSSHYSTSETFVGQVFDIKPMVPQEGNIRTIYPNDP